MKFYLRIQAKKKKYHYYKYTALLLLCELSGPYFLKFFQAQKNILFRISCYDIFGQLSLIFHACFYLYLERV